MIFSYFNKIKILYIHEKVMIHGGAEQTILDTATSLKRSFEKHFLCSFLSPEKKAVFNKAFRSVHTLSFDDKKAIKKLLKEISPSLIFLHKSHSSTLLETLFKSQIPIIRMQHDHENYCMRKYKYFPLTRTVCTYKSCLCCLFPGFAFIEKDPNKPLGIKWNSFSKFQKHLHLDKKCSYFVVASSYMKKELIHQGYDKSKVYHIPLSPKPFTKTPTQKRENQGKKLIYSGQITRGKGLDFLLKALAKVKGNFSLNVIGEGNFLPYCKALTKKLNLDKKVNFVGFIPHQDLFSYYQNSDIGIFPSVWLEPFGLCGIEMIQCALPVIAFDSGGVSDWLHHQENGFLIPPKDIDLMAEKIQFLLENEEVAKNFGKKSREIYEKFFTYDKYINSLESLFLKVIQKEYH